MEFINKKQTGFINENEWVEVGIYSSLALAIPLMIPSPQLITGPLVNAMLILSALHVRGLKSYIPAIIPSIIAYGLGMLLGSNTPFIIYLMPFIWLGNFALITIYKYSLPNTTGKWIKTMSISAVLKTITIFTGTLIIANHVHLPEQIYTVFGYMQIITALLGGFLAYIIKEVKK